MGAKMAFLQCLCVVELVVCSVTTRCYLTDMGEVRAARQHHLYLFACWAC
jgi:hypothetical protein